MDNAQHNPAIIPTSISHTALDSLRAKLSAIDGGWLNTTNETGDKTNLHHCGVTDDDDDDDDDDDGDNNINGSSKIGRPSSSSSLSPIDRYCALLQKIQGGIDDIDGKHPKQRRQTPLVNAGYAARMAVMTFVLEQWLRRVVESLSSKHCSDINNARTTTATTTTTNTNTTTTDCDDESINIVLLGCGMDVLGLWAKTLTTTSSPKSNIKVYEFDAWDNCMLKRRSLLNSGLLHESSCSFGDDDDNDCNDHRGVCQSQKSGITADSNATTLAKSFRTVSKGRTNVDGATSPRDENEDDYFLVALDLRESSRSSSSNQRKSKLSRAIHDIGLDSSRPTIVLSELVLAYLGREGADAAMHSIATDVLRGNARSMFACLEPVFPSDEQLDRRNNDTGNNHHHHHRHHHHDRARSLRSVQEGYSRDYSHQFLGKLQRGNSKQQRSTTTKSSSANVDSGASSQPSWLHPLGANSRDMRKRLEHCGFSSSSPDNNNNNNNNNNENSICCASLGNAAATVARIRRTTDDGAPNFLRAGEPFDEHAALALNLNCYGVACAFSPRASNDDDDDTVDDDEPDDWMGGVCPWRLSAKKGHNDGASSTVETIRPIESSVEDGQIRDLYGKIYVHLYDEYPAIRKMVKSALKMDLKSGTNTTTTDNGGERCRSAIRNRFRDKYGEFWVAWDATEARITGCVGIGLRKKREACEPEDSSSSSSGASSSSAVVVVVVVEYEIQRLAVDERCRGKGLGKRFLRVAEEYARRQQASIETENTASVTIKLWAITPECLIAANRLYESVGYRKEETFQAGSLRMNVYCKSLSLKAEMKQ